MESETAPKGRRGVAMMVVLGVVVFFTMLGFMGLEMATKDSQVSGTLLDIKSKESAAWGGLNLALGTMQANPATTVAELQKFIADSSKSVSSKRRWFSFSAGSFGLVADQPSSAYALGSGGDQTGVWVRLVSLDIGGASGIPDGSGVLMTLESTGQGRNGQQLRILATYRMLGVDVPTVTIVTNVPLPSNALYLNGSLSNLNSPIGSDAPVYTSGFYKANTNGSLTISSLKVGQYVDLAGTGSLTVTGNAYVGGYLFVNTGFPIWVKGSMGVGGGLSTFNDSLRVDGSLSIFGTVSGANWQSGKSLRVGGQLWIRDQALSSSGLDPKGAMIVGGNAFFDNGFRTASTARDSFYQAFQVRGTGLVDVAGPVYASRFLNAGSGGVTINTNSANDSFSVAKDFVNTNAASSLNIQASGLLSVRGVTQLYGGVSSWGIGSTGLRTRKRLDLVPGTGGNPGGKLDAWDTVTVNGSVTGNFGTFNTGASFSKRLFRVKTSSSASMTNQFGMTTVNASGFTFTVPTADPVLTPLALTSLGMTAAEVDVSLAGNPPDTTRMSGTGTTDWTGKFLKLSQVKGLISPALDPAACTGTMLSNLYNYAASNGKLSNGSTGYMFLYLDQPMTILSTDVSKFSGKMVVIVDASLDASYNWPPSATSSDIQVIYVPAGASSCSVCTGGGNLSQFGTTGPFYGYLNVEKTLTSTLYLRWGASTANVAHWYGMMSFGFNPNVAGSNTGGGLFIHLNDPATQSMFNDLATIGILHTVQVGAGSGVSVSTTKTLTVRSSAGSLQFVRVGEFR